MTANDMDRTKEAIFREIDSHQFTLLSMLADMAIDAGNLHRAAAYRWLAENKKWPSSCTNKRTGINRYLWQTLSHKSTYDILGHGLPTPATYPNSITRYNTIHEAIEAAVDMIEKQMKDGEFIGWVD